MDPLVSREVETFAACTRRTEGSVSHWPQAACDTAFVQAGCCSVAVGRIFGRRKTQFHSNHDDHDHATITHRINHAYCGSR